MTPSRLSWAVIGLVAALATACGSDNPAGPSIANVAGTWRITFTNMSGSGVTCSTTAIDYVITQSGATFTGTSSSTYTFTCTDGVNTISQSVTGGIITNGQITGTSISFDLATNAAHQTGTLSGNSISGTSTWTLDLGSSGTVVLIGQFGGLRL